MTSGAGENPNPGERKSSSSLLLKHGSENINN